MNFLEKLAGPLRAGRPFVALVSPSVRELMGDDWPRVNAVLKRAGARAVHPVDAGIGAFADLSAAEAARRGNGLHVLSACPMAAKFLGSRYPRCAELTLPVPSPMALQAKAALSAEGLTGTGWALALTPCAYKRIETADEGSAFRVVELRDFLAALGESGLALDGVEGEPYDVGPPADESHCAIAETVAARARGLGFPAQAVKLNGVKEAAAYFDRLSTDPEGIAGDKLTIVEISFCEGGCAGSPFAQLIPPLS